MNAVFERAPITEGKVERKVFGEHPLVELPVDQLVRLPQVRSGLNPDLPELKENIQAYGLLNPIDVAHMDQSQLEAYIDFVNHTWRTDVSVDDYERQRQPDGSFYMVIAGHSRTEAIYQLQQEEETDQEYAIVAKVYSATTPDDIIQLQLGENIHSKPSDERRAMAVVETYHYGLKHGVWKSKADFVRQSKGKGISQYFLDQALGFSQLPPEARDFVFSGNLPYGVAVELGLASDTIMDYEWMRLGRTDARLKGATEVIDEEFDEAYRQRITLIIAQIFNSGMNRPAAKKFIQGQKTHMEEMIGQADGAKAQPQLFLISVEEQAQAYRRSLKSDIKQAIAEMQHRSIDSVSTVMKLCSRLAGDETLVDFSLKREYEERSRQFGGVALRQMDQLAG